MFQPIRFSQAEAIKANGGNNTFFEGNTEQLVKITRAEFVTAKTGTLGIEFDVINRDKLKGYFSIWYQKADGSQNEYSHRMLQSLMGVTGVEVINPVSMAVPKYNFETKETVNVNCPNAAELIGKVFVGLFANSYEAYDGKLRTKTELYAALTQQRQTARELFAGKPAHDVEDLKKSMLERSATSKAAAEKLLGHAGQSNGGYQNDVDYFDAPPQPTTYQRTPDPQLNGYGQPQHGYGQPQTHQQPPAQSFAQGNPRTGSVDDDVPFMGITGALSHLI